MSVGSQIFCTFCRVYKRILSIKFVFCFHVHFFPDGKHGNYIMWPNKMPTTRLVWWYLFWQFHIEDTSLQRKFRDLLMCIWKCEWTCVIISIHLDSYADSVFPVFIVYVYLSFSAYGIMKLDGLRCSCICVKCNYSPGP